MAPLIAPDIVTKRFKITSFTAPLGFAPCRNERTRAQRSQLSFACAPHVGIDLDGDGSAHPRLRPHQTPARKITDGNQAEFKTTTLRRSQTVNQRRGSLSVYLEPRFTRTGQFHLRRGFVFYY